MILVGHFKIKYPTTYWRTSMITENHTTQTVAFNSRTYSVRPPTMKLTADYKWYRQIPPYEGSLWLSALRLAGVYMDSLDTVAWVTPVDGLRWKWRVKFLSWYDEGIVNGEQAAMDEVEALLADDSQD